MSHWNIAGRLEVVHSQSWNVAHELPSGMKRFFFERMRINFDLQSMLSTLQREELNDFWKEIKALNHQRESLPLTVGGTSGEGNIANLYHRVSSQQESGSEMRNLALSRSFVTKDISWLQTVEMIRTLKNNLGGKMQLAICWSGSSHFHLLRQESNCSSCIVTPFMDVPFGVIHSRTLLENLLSVIVTHSSVLLTTPDTPARVWHLRWTQLTITMWCYGNLSTAWWAE